MSGDARNLGYLAATASIVAGKVANVADRLDRRGAMDRAEREGLACVLREIAAHLATVAEEVCPAAVANQ